MPPTFTLSSQPARPKRDPAVFPPVAGIDYAMVALTHWLDAQLFACDVTRMKDLIDKGAAWLDQHGDNHPRSLEAALKLDHARIKGARAADICWFHCCSTYAALQHIDGAVWASSHAPGLDTGSPQTIWAALLPDEKPGIWPWPKKEQLEGGEWWNIPDQRRLLKRRKGDA